MYADIKLIVLKPIFPQILCGVAACLIGLQLTLGVIGYLSENNPKNESKKAFAALVSSGKGKETSVKFLSIPLFGEYIPKNLEQGDIKRSSLRLSLVGILFSLHEADSIVTIRSRGKGEQMFRIGDTLPGGAVIKHIMPDGVLISREGVMESLSLPKNELIFEQPPKPMSEE